MIQSAIHCCLTVFLVHSLGQGLHPYLDRGQDLEMDRDLDVSLVSLDV